MSVVVVKEEKDSPRADPGIEEQEPFGHDVHVHPCLLVMAPLYVQGIEIDTLQRLGCFFVADNPEWDTV